MLTNIREHWQEVVETRNNLQPDADGAVYLVSLNKRRLGVSAGRVSCNTPHVAALMLVQGTHREAEPHEIEAWKAEQLEKKRATEKAAAESSNRVNINLGDALLQLLAAQQSATPAQQVQAPKAPANQPVRHGPVRPQTENQPAA